MVLNGGSRLGVVGHLSITVRDAATGRVVDARRSHNLFVDTGLAYVASALNYGLVYALNASWGSPYSPPGAFYAAVGTDVTAVDATNTALGFEIGRAAVSNGAVSNAILSYDAFMSTGTGNGTINEIGLFGNADYQVPVLTAGLLSGSSYTSLTVGGLIGTIPTGATLTLNYGAATVQAVTTAAQANPGDTSITTVSFVAAQDFAAGTVAAYTPGVLIDRTVLVTPATKAASQTATVNLTVALESG